MCTFVNYFAKKKQGIEPRILNIYTRYRDKNDLLHFTSLSLIQYCKIFWMFVVLEAKRKNAFAPRYLILNFYKILNSNFE